MQGLEFGGLGFGSLGGLGLRGLKFESLVSEARGLRCSWALTFLGFDLGW
jgi:hypothetical protein